MQETQLTLFHPTPICVFLSFSRQMTQHRPMANNRHNPRKTQKTNLSRNGCTFQIYLSGSGIQISDKCLGYVFSSPSPFILFYKQGPLQNVTLAVPRSCLIFHRHYKSNHIHMHLTSIFKGIQSLCSAIRNRPCQILHIPNEEPGRIEAYSRIHLCILF